MDFLDLFYKFSYIPLQIQSPTNSHRVWAASEFNYSQFSGTRTARNTTLDTKICRVVVLDDTFRFS